MIHDSEPIGVCKAKSVRYATQRAASKAVEELEGLAPYEFRAKFGCDCREEMTDGTDESR
jgi:endoribonuclease Dicer